MPSTSERQFFAQSHPGEKNPRWKGGRVLRPDGYINLYRGPGNGGHSQYDLEHRVIAARALGRPLQRDEVVHHINMNKQDNRPENLLICSSAYNTWLLKRYAELYAKEYFHA